MSFGQYVQTILNLLVTVHEWDDPYGALSPKWDFQGLRLQFIYDSYMHHYAMRTPQMVAQILHEETHHWTRDIATQTLNVPE